MLYGAAAQNGVPAILAESGGCGLPIEQDVQRHVDGVLNIWRTLGLLTDAPPEPGAAAALDRRQQLAALGARGHLPVPRRAGRHGRRGPGAGRDGRPAGQPPGDDRRRPTRGVVLFTVTSPAIKKDGLLLAVGVPD